MILAAHDVRDREVAVVDRGGEVEGRPAVRAHEHEVGDLAGGEAHRPARRVLDDDLGRRHPEADDVRLAGARAAARPRRAEARGSARRSAPARAGRSSGRRAPWPAGARQPRGARRGARSGARARPRTRSRARRGRRGSPARRLPPSARRPCRRCAAAALRRARAPPARWQPPPRRSRGAWGPSARGRSEGGVGAPAIVAHARPGTRTRHCRKILHPCTADSILDVAAVLAALPADLARSDDAAEWRSRATTNAARREHCDSAAIA